jgi:hypothetical protein
MSGETICLWCTVPYFLRRGGSPRKFCSTRCRHKFHSCARRWAEAAIDLGILTIDDIRSGDPAACTLLLEATSLAPAPPLAEDIRYLSCLVWRASTPVRKSSKRRWRGQSRSGGVKWVRVGPGLSLPGGRINSPRAGAGDARVGVCGIPRHRSPWESPVQGSRAGRLRRGRRHRSGALGVDPEETSSFLRLPRRQRAPWKSAPGASPPSPRNRSRRQSSARCRNRHSRSRGVPGASRACRD